MDCPPILFPETRNCSGRGVCTFNSSCLCESGWSGRSDFVAGSPGCSVNIVTVQVFWIFLSCLHFLTFLISVKYLHVKLKQKRTSSSSKLPLYMVVMIMVSDILFCCLGILRSTSYETRVIGYDETTTFLFSVGAAIYWSMIHVATLALLEAIYQQSTLFKKPEYKYQINLNFVRGGVAISCIVSIICCLMPLGMLGKYQETDFQIYASIHYIGLAMIAFMIGIVGVPWYCTKLLKTISLDHEELKHIQNREGSLLYEKLVKKVQFVRRELIKQSSVQSLLAFTFGIWPFLQIHGTAYWLPLAWASAAFIAWICMFLNLPVG
jgi:hypothetical protein